MPAAELERAIADLNDERYPVRAKAFALLETQGELGALALRKALKDGMSLEMRRRVELLLSKFEQYVPPPNELRTLRALAVLERIGDAQARKVVGSLTRGSPEARLTQQARVTLLRMGRSPGST
jgi:hypothetical protein